MHFTLTDSNGSALYIHERFVRYENRIFDASSISTIRVKKNKILFNSFKQNTTLPTLTVSFDTEAQAVEALNNCMTLYQVCDNNPYYDANDEQNEYYLPDAYGGNLIVTPQYLSYRNRMVGTSEIKTVSVKGRRVLINNFKGNVSSPTMCVHFADKDAATNAMNRINTVVWNVKIVFCDETCECDKPDITPDTPTDEDTGILTKRADPAFLNFVAVMTGTLFILNIIRGMMYLSGSGRYNDDEL